MMKKIGITGQNGFVGYHLYHTLQLLPQAFELIPFERSFFESEAHLDAFVSQCDAIVHLAALNRHADEQVLHDTNVELAEKLVAALERTGAKPHVLVSSSTQEERDNLYGKSKHKARTLLAQWAERNGAIVSGLIVPNVFGAFGQPFYNSFIATFCHLLTTGGTPTVAQDAEVNLIYVQELVEAIIAKIREGRSEPVAPIAPTATRKVSTVLALLESYRDSYLGKGAIPPLADRFELQLFNTYRSFIDYKTAFPRRFQLHSDPRGTFVEIIRHGIGGQSSYSTTVPGITRGNHYHTRKIERFAVVKGKALIQLRKIGSSEVIDLYLDGSAPAYVDMPIWYTHNIKNVGEEELITMFWINEPYDPADPDTYFEDV